MVLDATGKISLASSILHNETTVERLGPQTSNVRLSVYLVGRLLYRLCDPDALTQPRANLGACMMHWRHESPSVTKADTPRSLPFQPSSREPFVGPDLHV